GAAPRAPTHPGRAKRALGTILDQTLGKGTENFKRYGLDLEYLMARAKERGADVTEVYLNYVKQAIAVGRDWKQSDEDVIRHLLPGQVQAQRILLALLRQTRDE